MPKLRHRSLSGALIAFFLLSSPVAPLVWSQGIPEPSLLVYGTIRNSADNNLRLTFGTINWQYRNTASGRTVTLTTQVSNILDQFSFVLEVPCETFVSGFTVSSNALQLTPIAAMFDRAQVSVDGSPGSFVVLGQRTTSISSTNRGAIERIDLTVNIPLVDGDGNGLPDNWETYYFGFVGVNPNGDSDGDGLSNAAEYRAGTDPLDGSSNFRFVNVSRHPPNGFQVEWSSVEGRSYSIERSSTLLSGFSTIKSNIVATPPKNTDIDNNANGVGPFFYRLRVQ